MASTCSASPAFVFALAIGCSTNDAGPVSAARDAGRGDGAHPRSDDAAMDASAASGVTAAPEGKPWQTLAEWHLFRDPAKQTPADRVIPYDVNSQLFADYAAKRRFIYVPAGLTIGYEPTDKWRFPVGTILVKTFSSLADLRDASAGETLLETRLLIHESGGWKPHTYVWSSDQTAATLQVAADPIPRHFVNDAGKDIQENYTVPNENDCRECHGKTGTTNTLGGRTRQLDRNHDYGNGPENQIDHLAKLGFFDGAPDPESARERLVDPFGAGNSLERVRSYLDANCGHCHQPGTAAGSPSGFWVDYASTAPTGNPVDWGVCKQPTSAGGATCGRQLDVVPGTPSLSIIDCRMASTAPNVRMPPLGRNLVDEQGLALIRDWVSSMAGACTAPPPDGGSKDSGPDARPRDAGAHRPDARPSDAGSG